MNQITIVEVAGELVVDSRIIAEQLGIEHKHFVRNIRSHQTVIEEHFGVLSFETAKPSEDSLGGRPETFVWLTESQSTFVMTLSRNSPKVLICKVGLVKAFSEQKRQLENPIDRKLFTELAVRVASLEENSIAKLEIQPKPSLPRASIDPVAQPIEPLTERALINRLIHSYVHNQTTSQPKTEQDVYSWMYLELKYRYHYDVYAWAKKSGLKKLDQIEADGKLPELLAICDYFLSN
jgi:phage regulator Rha-like protein